MDTYGKDIGPSEIVHGGRVFQIGSRPGQLDAHVRPNCLVLRCEHEAGPLEMSFNDEDAAILEHVARIAARGLAMEL